LAHFSSNETNLLALISLFFAISSISFCPHSGLDNFKYISTIGNASFRLKFSATNPIIQPIQGLAFISFSLLSNNSSANHANHSSSDIYHSPAVPIVLSVFSHLITCTQIS
jgi:hypothetical protein